MKNTNLKKELVAKYQTTVDDNVKIIEKIFTDLGIDSSTYLDEYKTILHRSSEYVSGRWEKGEKYTRTEFVMSAFGSRYPESIVGLSLSIDAMINILDDLLDENLEPKIKMLFVVEYLRAFAIYNSLITNSMINERMSSYFNKLIMLAVFENAILSEFKKNSDLSKMSFMATELLISRAQDIDIFVEIALLSSKFSEIDKELILKSARYFRAVNIFKKDILDIRHDKENGQETLVTVALDKSKEIFSEFALEVSGRFEKESKKLLLNSGRKCAPAESFYGMLKVDNALVESKSL